MKSRPHLVLVIVAAAVVALAVLAGVLSANRELPTLDPTTPEGTAQLFVIAVTQADGDAALDYLDPALRCKAPLLWDHPRDGLSMTVAGSNITGERATVHLDVTESTGAPFSTYQHREEFKLRRNGESWLLSEVPWPVYGCR